MTSTGSLVGRVRGKHADDQEHGLHQKPVSRMIYGLITVLSVLQVMDAYPPSAWRGTALLFGTTLAVALADAYSESVATILSGQRAMTGAQLREIGHEVAPILAGAQAPTGLLLLSALGLISVELAVTLAQIVGFLMLFWFGMRVGHLLHERWIRQLANGLFLVAIGGLVVGIKVLVH